MLPRRTSRATAALAALAVLWLLAGCGSTNQGTPAPTPRQALATAKKHLDRAQSVHLRLSTAATPTHGDAVLGADGVLTHQPAFRGTVKVLLGGFTAQVPVVSVGGQVHAKLPLTPRYSVIDPSEYGAPDPAAFADPSSGISGLLVKLRHPKQAGRTRDGTLVLTTYTGALRGSLVRPIIPSANPRSSYRTTVGIDDHGRVATLAVTGHFFSGSKQATYDLTFGSYDRHVRVTAP